MCDIQNIMPKKIIQMFQKRFDSGTVGSKKCGFNQAMDHKIIIGMTNKKSSVLN